MSALQKPEKHKVFVFGTLKQGFPNFHLNHGQQLPGQFQTAQPYPLYLIGDRHSPWLINDPGHGELVTGEIYFVGDQELETMDQLERVEKKYGYRREIIQVKNIETSETLTVFCYLKPEDQLKTKNIKFGPLDQYELHHADLYQSRNSRADLK